MRFRWPAAPAGEPVTGGECAPAPLARSEPHLPLGIEHSRHAAGSSRPLPHPVGELRGPPCGLIRDSDTACQPSRLHAGAMPRPRQTRAARYGFRCPARAARRMARRRFLRSSRFLLPRALSRSTDRAERGLGCPRSSTSSRIISPRSRPSASLSRDLLTPPLLSGGRPRCGFHPATRLPRGMSPHNRPS